MYFLLISTSVRPVKFYLRLKPSITAKYKWILCLKKFKMKPIEIKLRRNRTGVVQIEMKGRGFSVKDCTLYIYIILGYIKK